MVLNPSEKITASDFLLIGVVFAALVTRILLAPPILHHGEAREGLVVQAIVQKHQWILPFRNGELPSKPPLFHWIAAILARVFGLSDTVVRLPSAVSATVMAFVTFVMGIAIGGRVTAWLAVGVLLGMFQFWDAGTQARVDMVLAACVTVSLAGFFFWYRDRNGVSQATCYIAAACAVLTKGPVGILLTGMTIVGFLVVERKLRLLWKFWSWRLVALVLVIDAGWYAFAFRVGGDEFLRLQIVQENLSRFLGTGKFFDEEGYLSMAGPFVTQMLPWILVLPWCLIRRLQGKRGDASDHFLHAWWISIFGFFLLAARTRAVYLLPLHPAIALLAAQAIASKLATFNNFTFGRAQRARVVQGELRPLRTAGGQVTIGIALLDLTLMLVNPAVWKNFQSKQHMLAFINRIAKVVPRQDPLYASPDVANTDRWIIAYRLGRRIEVKPIDSINRNEYVLSSGNSTTAADSRKRVLAVAEGEQIRLITGMLDEFAVRR
jgi:4-amino-4-deoxy-L-arabinose transferase-like glycosyltransferase